MSQELNFYVKELEAAETKLYNTYWLIKRENKDMELIKMLEKIQNFYNKLISIQKRREETSKIEVSTKIVKMFEELGLAK